MNAPSRQMHATNVEKPLISVLMAVYNGAAFLDEAVKSVLRQTYAHWELLIVDDGSSDDSLQRAQRWAETDARIRVLQHPGGSNRGVSASRNLAVRYALGSYLAILDCDDVWRSEKLERQVEVVRRYPDVVLVYGKACTIDARGHPFSEDDPWLDRPAVFGSGCAGKPANAFKDMALHRFWVPASSALFARRASEACGHFDERLPFQVEDTLLFVQLSEQGCIFFIDEILIDYRIHGNQWNTAMTAVRRSQGRFYWLYLLSEKVQPRHRDMVSGRLTAGGFGKLCDALLAPSVFAPLLLMKYLGMVLSSRHVSFRHKVLAILLILRRAAGLPLERFR